MGFHNYLAIDRAYEEGRVTTAGFRKVCSSGTITTRGIWYDLSMVPGLPIPNYYASSPLTFKRLSQSEDGGLYHGGAVSPATKHLKMIQTQLSTRSTSVPANLRLLDYLGYYPFVEMAGEVTLSSGLGLSRYTDGVGVQIMAVLVAPHAGGARFTCSYTNQAGVSGRITQESICTTQAINGTIVTTGPTLTAGFHASPFIPLQIGDTGVRSIQSIIYTVEDVGLLALVLVKPLASLCIEAITADTPGPAIYNITECDYALDKFGTLPVIKDDAYLNFIVGNMGSLQTAVLSGLIETIWTA
jgi:hypothetical protein